MTVARKGLSVWLFSSLTFVALIHLLDAVSAFVFNNPIRLLELYPMIGEQLQTISPGMYFLLTGTITLVLWAITCRIAFENPVETFLKQVLSDAKAHSTVETQLLDNKSEVLDAMFDTIEASSETLAQVKDLVCNVRTEAREIQPLRETIDNLKVDLCGLKKEFRKMRENMVSSTICQACGKPLMPEFNVCPYCGESMTRLKAPVLTLKDFR
jgi:hypothetical protein